MQIKRTRLRLVTYIQVLSRAAYLPNRYMPIFRMKKFALIFLLLILTGCPAPSIYLANVDGEGSFTIYNSERVKMTINDPAIYHSGKISIPFYINNNSEAPIVYHARNNISFFHQSQINCDIDCIASFSYAQWDSLEGPGSVWHTTVNFSDEPPKIEDLNYEIEPYKRAALEVVIMIPKEFGFDGKNLKQIEKSLEKELLQIKLGHILIGSDSHTIEEFYLRTDRRFGR